MPFPDVSLPNLMSKTVLFFYIFSTKSVERRLVTVNVFKIL